MKVLKVLWFLAIAVGTCSLVYFGISGASRIVRTEEGIGQLAEKVDQLNAVVAGLATTSQLANAVSVVTQDVTKVLVADGDKTRIAIAADGDKTRIAIAADGKETRELVMSEATGIHGQMSVDRVSIERRLRAHGKRLAATPPPAETTVVGGGTPAATIDLSNIATKEDLAAMEKRLMAQSEIVVKPEGSTTIKKTAEPEKPAEQQPAEDK